MRLAAFRHPLLNGLSPGNGGRALEYETISGLGRSAARLSLSPERCGGRMKNSCRNRSTHYDTKNSGLSGAALYRGPFEILVIPVNAT